MTKTNAKRMNARIAWLATWATSSALLALFAAIPFAFAQSSQQGQSSEQNQAAQQSGSGTQQDNNVEVKDKKKETEKQAKKEDAKKAPKDANLPALLWTDRGDISQLDMISGQGGAKYFPDPKMEYTYAGENLDGTSTKFYVVDANKQKWLVKLGVEAQPETAATRFVWAMGYFTDEDYFEPQIHVKGLPKLKRNMYDADVKTGMVPNVRLKRQYGGSKKINTWDWFDNPFLGTREFNGLRVMMAVLNNWDLKEQNNKVYVADGQRRYVVSDLGAAFGKTGAPLGSMPIPFPRATKGDFDDYEKSKFIKEETANTVSFEMNTKSPVVIRAFRPNYFGEYNHMVKIEDDIPIADAKWIGERLAQLTHEQVVNAFRAAGYIPEDAEAYAKVVELRIAQLNQLQAGGAPAQKSPQAQR